MKKIKLNSRYVELTNSINCIPAGIYKIRSADEDFLHFTIGPEVHFSISYHSNDSLRSVSKKTGVLRKTSQEVFLKEYYALMDAMPKKSFFDPTQPITMCMIDPKVAYECH